MDLSIRINDRLALFMVLSTTSNFKNQPVLRTCRSKLIMLYFELAQSKYIEIFSDQHGP